MEQFRLSSDSTSDDFIPIALAVHAVLGGLPVTIRSQNHRGVQIEDGKVKSRNYTGLTRTSSCREHCDKDATASGRIHKRTGDSCPNTGQHRFGNSRHWRC